MIFELRSYEFAPGEAQPYLALFQETGLAHVTRHLPLMGYWLTETGGLNRLHHLWAYENLEDRSQRRVRLMADEAWTKGFVPKGFPMIRAQASRLMSLLTASERVMQLARRANGEVAALPAKAPVLGSGWAALALTHAAPSGSVAASWRVLSGADTGAVLTLQLYNDASAVAFGGPNDIWQEIMRPTAFSPL